MITQSIIEITIAALFIAGLFNEDKLARLERKLFKKLTFTFKCGIMHKKFKEHTQ